MTSRKDRKAAKRARRARQRQRAAEERLLAARVRVGPEPTTRIPDEDHQPVLATRPFEQRVADYRQTPESWRAVWSEK